MCGIAGQYFFNNQRASNEGVELAIESILHRGPDNQSTFVQDNLSLGHARLAILDLDEKANQPFFSPDKRYAMVFNGEIYNYLSLKKELKADQEYKTSSDTEVLLYWLIEKGQKGLNDLNGFFAIAFFDLENNTGFIARDTMGIKPLCYSLDEEGLSFCSGVKGVKLMLDQVSIDHNAIGQYIQHTYIPAPLTIYNEVKKLFPGEVLSIQNNGSVEFSKIDSVHLHREAKTLDATLEEAVRLRLQSDVPVGTFLSGGIDSSLISAIARKHAPDLKTFSIGFESGVFDESSKAEKIAKHIDSQHTTIRLDNQTAAGYFDDLIDKLDEPFADSSSAAVYALCKHVRSEITVALSGDGADELFAGYNKHKALKMSLTPSFSQKTAALVGGLIPFQGSRDSKTGNRIRQLKKWSELSHLKPEERFLRLASFTKREQSLALIGEPYTSYNLARKFNGGFKDFLLMDQELVLPNDMLAKVDKMSMAHSLEVRVPFLDLNVVHASRQFSEETYFDRKRNKNILYEHFKDLLPEWVFSSEKHGFEIPVKKWLQTGLKEEFLFQLSEEQCKKFGLIDYRELKKLMNQLNKSASGDVIYPLWSIFVLHKWLEKHHA